MRSATASTTRRRHGKVWILVAAFILGTVANLVVYFFLPSSWQTLGTVAASRVAVAIVLFVASPPRRRLLERA